MATKICSKCKIIKDESEFSTSGYICKDSVLQLRSWCKRCCSENTGKWYRNNPKQAKVIDEEKRNKNAEKYLRIRRKSGKKYRKANPDYYKKWRQKRRFVAALKSSRSDAKRRKHIYCSASVKEIEEAFTGYCDICGVPEIELTHRLCLEHNHKTGQFRGWVCPHCNRAIAFVRDSYNIAEKLATYLIRFEKVELT